MFYKEILEQTGPGSSFVEDLEVQFVQLSTNKGGVVVDSMYLPVSQKNSETLDEPLPEKIN